MEDLATSVRVWWTALVVLAVCNVCFWAYATVAFMRRRRTAPEAETARFPHVLLSGGYVFGTAFLWLLPRSCMHRYCLVDTWLSGALVGRSVRTFAELCFLLQWTLLLREFARAERSSFGTQVARMILPLGLGAQVCAWFAVVTQNHAGLAAEQAIWAIIASSTALALTDLWKRAFSPLRGFIALCILCCIVFVVYAWVIEVPLHLARYRADEAQGLVYLTWSQGFADATSRTVVARDFGAWRAQMGWTAVYASAALWLSISFMHAPLSHRSFQPRVTAIREPLPRLSELPTNPRRMLKS